MSIQHQSYNSLSEESVAKINLTVTIHRIDKIPIILFKKLPAFDILHAFETGHLRGQTKTKTKV